MSSRVQCSKDHLVNPNNIYNIFQDDELRKSSFNREPVQLRPQHVKLSLRVNEAYEMKFFYEQAMDYPVDLYYLMDLSQSMKDDKEKLSALGDLLSETMQNLTSNFKLGFGSFVDKTVMPYVSTVPQKLQEPCDGCAAPYGYKHHMTLDTKTSDFAREVKRAQVSGNLDAPEGGFDAIMQAVVCKNEIGWRDKARKLLVFSTDAGFHYAGDGKLGGIVTPNDGKCHMENNMYTHSTILDYPSVSQINKVVKENSVNLIFAVTDSELKIYEQLSAAVEGSSVGRLSNDSSNVVQLVVAQYEAITSVLEMKDNATGNVKVTYFSSCTDANGPLRQTNKCSGLKVGSKVSFTAKIEVLKCPKDPREWNQRFQISPVGINESVLVDLEMICNCACEQAGNLGYEENSPQCDGVGTYKCGVCQCPADYFGRNCECSAANINFQGEWEAGCRSDNTTQTLCNNRGDCICGKCECLTRENPEEVVSGEFCECDNFSCDRHHGLLCSGPDHGECVCGRCVCNSEWDVPGYSACECRASNETCITPYGKYINQLCSGHGTCECGECKCEETEEGQYSGRYCEDCPTCPGKCDELAPCVQCKYFKSGPLMDVVDEWGVEECSKCPFDEDHGLVVVEKAEDYIFEDERLCTDLDDDQCRFTYVYGYNNKTGQLQVWVQATKECPQVVDILGIVLGVIGAIVAAGITLIIMWKIFVEIHDRREFAKFEKERREAQWDAGMNPIYKQATSTFKNPTYNGRM